MDIDKEELMKQLREQIVKSGKYMKIEIIVGDMKQFNMPYVQVKNIHAPIDSMAVAYNTLDSTKEALKKVVPGIDIISTLFHPEDGGIIFHKKDKGEQNGK